MNQKVITISILLVFISMNLLFGQDDYVKDRVNKFFNYLSNAEYKDALDFIYSDNSWMQANIDEVNKVKAQFVGLPDMLGSYISHDLLVEETFLDKLIVFEYFVAFDRQPIRFQFEFYNSKDGWMIYGFSYSDDIDDWLEERAKFKYIYDRD